MTHHPYQLLASDPMKGHLGSALSRYIHNLAYTDKLLAKLLNFLKQTGDLKNTVIIFTGDHGEGFGEHGIYVHSNDPYEEGIHVPLIYFDGARQKPSVDTNLRSQMDIVPTLLKRVGIQYSGSFPGVSLYDKQGHEKIYTSGWELTSSKTLITRDIKWISSPYNSTMQAYDLSNDPGERHNIIKQFDVKQKAQIANEIKAHVSSIMRFYRPRQ
jgi:arylsulfatase A-like enzyme